MKQIDDIEARVAALDLSMSQVCRKAGIPINTWSHWKMGKRSPLKTKWDAIESAVSDLERRLFSSTEPSPPSPGEVTPQAGCNVAPPGGTFKE